MPVRQRQPPPSLPTTHYFVSISRGERIRTVMLTPAALWALIAIVPVSLGAGVAGALDLALADRAPVAVALRAADDPGDAPSEAERRGAVEAEALDARIRAVVARQIGLEKRNSVVATLAESARRLQPASAASPPAAGRPRLDTLGGADRPQPSFAALAAGADLDPPTRLAFVDRSLDRVESHDMSALSAIDRFAADAADRDAVILADVGLDADRLGRRDDQRAVGGPFVPIEAGPDASAFDRTAARVARDVARTEKLDALMAYVPLGKPLAGEAPVASPFGYRIDPFLGRPALHTGVDLLQSYGAEVMAAGSGRVVHAGAMGGYGLMVEIDHGDGLTSRYGHLSETLVSEGEAVGKGAVVGRLGSTGRSTGPHLHYEVRIDGNPVDPERFLRAGERMAAE
jgi:murein DD-endopeptidase MepM/ murein hydrolase activator NlpD